MSRCSCAIVFQDLWLQGVAVVLPQVQTDLNPSRVEFATLALYVGLIIGATTWGSLADVIGRKLSWQITLFLSVSVKFQFDIPSRL